MKDNDGEMDFCSSNMNHIYDNANVTIVAANDERACSGGSHCQRAIQAGLPRVLGEATSLQKLLKTGGM